MTDRAVEALAQAIEDATVHNLMRHWYPQRPKDIARAIIAALPSDPWADANRLAAALEAADCWCPLDGSRLCVRCAALEQHDGPALRQHEEPDHD